MDDGHYLAFPFPLDDALLDELRWERQQLRLRGLNDIAPLGDHFHPRDELASVAREPEFVELGL